MFYKTEDVFWITYDGQCISQPTPRFFATVIDVNDVKVKTLSMTQSLHSALETLFARVASEKARKIKLAMWKRNKLGYRGILRQRPI